MVRVDGRQIPWREGMTLADVLHELGDPYPYAVARINGTSVSRPNFAAVTVPDETEVFLIPLIVGG